MEAHKGNFENTYQDLRSAVESVPKGRRVRVALARPELRPP
jgi:hypothetical protein